MVNDAKDEHSISAEQSHPHAVDLGEQMIDLNTGENRISFRTLKPYCPNVEFIKVSQDAQNYMISSERYDQYIEELSKQKLPDNYNEIKEAAIAEESSNESLMSAPDPQCEYKYELEQDFGYTYYYTLFIFPGSTFTFETKNATSDPVMHLFHYNYPDLYSWTKDDGGSGYNSKIVANITYFGIFYVLIRKNSTAVAGICDLS